MTAFWASCRLLLPTAVAADPAELDEYVVWEEADGDRVRAWGEFPPYYDNPEALKRNQQ
jgi:hypothetical protein